MIEDLVIDKSRLFTAGKQPKKPKRGRCFADDKFERCTLLLRDIKKDCKTCPFHKTKEEFEEGREKALERLKTLNVATKRYIAEKYKIKMKLLDIPLQSIDRGPTK